MRGSSGAALGAASLRARFSPESFLDFALPEPATLACHSDALFAVGGVRYMRASLHAQLHAQMHKLLPA